MAQRNNGSWVVFVEILLYDGEGTSNCNGGRCSDMLLLILKTPFLLHCSAFHDDLRRGGVDLGIESRNGNSDSVGITEPKF